VNHLGLYDRIIDHFTGSQYKDEIARAKKDFFGPTGSFEEDNEQFEAKMSLFLDWNIFDRNLSDVGLTPIESIKEIGSLRLEDSDKGNLESLLNPVHSVFEFIKIKNQNVYLKDLIHRKKYIIEDSNVLVGFTRDELFEARLIPVGKSYQFSSGFCFHPLEAKKYILKEIKKIKKLGEPERNELMDRLARMRMKFDQFKHIRPEYIYTNDKKMRI